MLNSTKSGSMADTIIRLAESDVKGAVLPLKSVEDNDIPDLIRWLHCRGFSATKSESKKQLVERVKDLQDSGLAKFVVDPDGECRNRVLQSLTLPSRQLQEIPKAEVSKWTHNLADLPSSVRYSTIVEYLIKRRVTLVNRADDGNESDIEEVYLPTAEKPLRKGYNFFKSGHLSDIKVCRLDSVSHVTAMVLASYREKKYRTDIVFDNRSGLVMTAKCGCVAGHGGKCNHISGLLFGVVDFVHSYIQGPESCTSQEQKWHQPSRKAKKMTKPLKIGDRIVQRHVYGRQLKRKRALEDYKKFNSRVRSTKRACLQDTKEALKSLKDKKHDTGLLQLLNSSTDTASEGEEIISPEPKTQILPEEAVVNKLQVTREQRDTLQERTVGQSTNPIWFQERKGRVTASNAKKFVGRGNANALVKNVITVKRPSITKIPAMAYGIANEDNAVKKYVVQKQSAGGHVNVVECGLFVDLTHGQLAASPDRLVDDQQSSDPHGIIEVKCLYSCRDYASVDEAIEANSRKSPFPCKLVNGAPILKENHQYFYQVQMQMAVSQRNWCDFVLFINSEADVKIICVVFDREFWERLRNKLLSFHSTNIVPALVAQGFYK